MQRGGISMHTSTSTAAQGKYTLAQGTRGC